MEKRETAVHERHCNQGDYEGSCKYGDKDCPAIEPGTEIINVNWEPSMSSGSEEFSLAELEVSCIEEWKVLSYDEQQEKIAFAFDERPEVLTAVPITWSEQS